MRAARFGGAQSATLSPLHDTKRSRIVEVVCDVSFCSGEHPFAISMSRRDPYPRLMYKSTAQVGAKSHRRKAATQSGRAENGFLCGCLCQKKIPAHASRDRVGKRPLLCFGKTPSSFVPVRLVRNRTDGSVPHHLNGCARRLICILA